jgi:hypothetical protein
MAYMTLNAQFLCEERAITYYLILIKQVQASVNRCCAEIEARSAFGSEDDAACQLTAS